jgi:long-chain fatty acid transport protein
MSNLRNYASLNLHRLALGLLTLVAIPTTSLAAAFAVNEQSITYLGNAYAGTSSAVQDASTSYYNPAGLSYLAKKQLVVSGAYNHPHINLYDATATNSAGDVVTGANPSKPSANIFVPGLNAAYKVNKRVALGFSLVELFATDIKYEGNSIARYMATTTKINTIDISPSIGVMLHKKLHVGAALDFMKINMNLSSDVAWGDTGSEALGYVNTYMNGWSYGYHIGVLYVPNKKVRMGLVYFSRFSPNLQGNVYSAQTLDFGTPRPTYVTSNFSLPDRLNYSITTNFTRKLIGMAEVEWTHWSRLRTVTLKYNSTARPGTIVFDFKNTWRFSLGGDYNFTRNFAMKLGLAYDQTPVNNSHISVRVPENDRYIIGVGMRYKLHRMLSVVGAYSHVFMRTFSISETAATESLNSSPNVANVKTLNGTFNNSADIFGLQVVFTL